MIIQRQFLKQISTFYDSLDKTRTTSIEGEKRTTRCWPTKQRTPRKGRRDLSKLRRQGYHKCYGEWSQPIPADQSCPGGSRWWTWSRVRGKRRTSTELYCIGRHWSSTSALLERRKCGQSSIRTCRKVRNTTWFHLVKQELN